LIGPAERSVDASSLLSSSDQEADMTDDQTDSDAPSGDDAEVPETDDRFLERLVDRITPDARVNRVELATTVILAIAGVLIAWAGLQSAKWSGEQAIHFSEAGASRTESVRFDNLATSTILLDVQTFLAWGQANQTETIVAEANGVDRPDPAVYDPADPTLSGYLFSQFREDFQPRVLEWLEGGGPANPEGSSPFDPLDAYIEESVPPALEADRLAEVADDKAASAREDNQNSDNYVVTVVILASVLFFAALSGKMKVRRNQNLMFSLAFIMLVWAGLRLATLPIHAIP
jgi:hypothetical protein